MQPCIPSLPVCQGYVLAARATEFLTVNEPSELKANIATDRRAPATQDVEEGKAFRWYE